MRRLAFAAGMNFTAMAVTLHRGEWTLAFILAGIAGLCAFISAMGTRI